MTCSLRTLTRALAACVCIFSFTSGLRAQGPTAVQLPGPWPTGWTGCACIPSNGDAFQILYTAGIGYPCQIPDAALRLTIGGCNSPIFGQLGVVDSLHDPYYLPTLPVWFSAFAPINATVLRSSEGDLILSATTFAGTPTHGPVPLTASIRFGTTPDTLSSNVDHPAEIERAEILGNGNFGIDLPMDLATRLGKPLDQVQIGGGVFPYPGNPSSTGPLTIYGGNPLENTPRPGGGLYPGDWRYIAFNSYVDHTDTSANRSHRFQPASSAAISFSDNDLTHDGGMIDLHCMPFDTARSLDDFRRGIQFHLMGSKGIEAWCDVSDADPYHHLFDCYRPGYLGGGAFTRNTNGLFFHHTPVYIGSDTNGEATVDFQNLPVHPDIGEGTTWDLVVNGPALFKEAYVNSADWPDYVLMRHYKLMSIDDFGNYIEANHHLPEIPSAKKMDAAIPLGKTEADITKQVEELSLYIVQLNKEIEALKTEVQDLKKGGK